MSWFSGVQTRVRLLFARGSAESRMAEEFRFHLEMEEEERMREGVDRVEARRQAFIAFGGMNSHRETIRDERGTVWLEDILRDLRFGVRSFRRNLLFTFVSVVTIALGVGATTIAFGLINSFFLRPLPLPNSDRLLVVTEARTGAVSQGMDGRAMPYGRYTEFEKDTRVVFSGLAAQRFATFAMRTESGAVAVEGTLTSGNYFAVLGVLPQLGQTYSGDDEPVLVLSHGVWLDRFGGDPEVIGRLVYLDGQPFTIVGVAPADFMGTTPALKSDIWVPLRAARRHYDLAAMASWVTIFGRLNATSSESDARALVDVVARRTPPAEPQTRVSGADVAPLVGIARGTMRSDGLPIAALVLGLAASVLVIASANVTGMLLFRGLARRREMAIRLAVGAGRRRVFRQLLTESALLASLGGAGGVLIAMAGSRLVAAAPLPLPPGFDLDLSLDVRVLLFALAVTMTTAILVGFVPAHRASEPAPLPSLKDGASTGGKETQRLRSVFVGGQVAVAVFLVVLAGFFLTSLRRALDVDLGYEPEGVVIATVNLDPHGYGQEEGRLFYSNLTERLTAIPGVREVGLARVALLGGSPEGNDVEAAEGGIRLWGVSQNRVTPGFFETLRLPLVAGRSFTGSDMEGAPPVTVVNEFLANRLWPGGNAIGQRIKTFGGEFEVIGVVRDGQYSFRNGMPAGFAFFSHAQRYSGSMTIHLRGSTPPAELIQRIEGEVRALDPDIAVQGAQLLSSPLQRLLGPQKTAATMLSALAAVGLILAAMGVYGVLAFYVAQRRKEFGVRIALGASARSVVLNVVGRTGRSAAMGGFLGLTAAAVASLGLSRFLYGIGPIDPLVFAPASVVLFATVLLASYVPVRRAVKADPLQVLRIE